jgi:CheY-like chemotaxis protein
VRPAPAIALEPLLAREAPRIRVFLCDDAPELRALLRAFMELGGDVEIVGEAEDGESLAGHVRDAQADVVLVDLSMPRVDGFEALAELRADDPGLDIIVLSGFEPTRMAAKALALGADRYLERRGDGGRARHRPRRRGRPPRSGRAAGGDRVIGRRRRDPDDARERPPSPPERCAATRPRLTSRSCGRSRPA